MNLIYDLIASIKEGARTFRNRRARRQRRIDACNNCPF